MHSNQIFTPREYLGDNNYQWLCDVTEPLSPTIKERPTIVLVGLNQTEAKNSKKETRLLLNQLCNYFDAECFRVVTVAPEKAFDIILWEQPAMTIIEGLLPPYTYMRLLQRLRQHPLTVNLIVAVWGTDSQGNMVSSNLLQASCQPEAIGERLERITETLQQIRPQAFLNWDYEVPQAGSVVGIDSASIDDGTLAGHLAQTELVNLLNDQQLRQFVNEVLDSWPTLQLAVLLGQNADLIVNREILWQYLGLETEVAEAALYSLAHTNYIELLEYEGDDPLFAVVAWPERLELLKRFGQALTNQSYRLVLANLLLTRERV